MRSREWARHKELLVFEDGRVYDTSEDKFLTIMMNHSGSIDGPMVLWTTNDKTYTLNLCVAMYEAFNGLLTKDYTAKLADQFKPVTLDNIKKVLKYTKNTREMKEMSFDGSWMAGGIADLYQY